jgi:pyruvate dehydrogenase E2 component (dihydrolipoamide acetyltransferase)
MAIEIFLPQRGMGMSEATVVSWHIKEGDHVEEGDKLVDVESSKATDEIASPVSGIVTKIFYQENDEVEVGAILALVTPLDEMGSMPGGEEKVDGGVEPVRAASTRMENKEMTRVRQLTAQRMWESLQKSAQLTLFADVDMTETVSKREALKSETGLTYTDILIKVVADTLGRHPEINSYWKDGRIFPFEQINIGIAVDMDDGLVVPVIKNAGQKSLQEIHILFTKLVEKARQGTLVSEDISDGTFTVSNLGKYRVDHFTPILNPPETGILGVGRITKKALVVHDEIAIRSVMGLSLTFDHRVVDGVPAAAFLEEICSILEESAF